MLRQIDDDEFSLRERLVVTWPPGADGSTLVIEPASLTHTDLASIPSFFGWFARRHGRHTRRRWCTTSWSATAKASTAHAAAGVAAQPGPDLRFRQLLLASGSRPCGRS